MNRTSILIRGALFLLFCSGMLCTAEDYPPLRKKLINVQHCLPLPSEYVKKVERSFAGHRVLGLVLRFGAKAADWVDDGMFSMAWRSTRKHFRALHEQIVAHKADRVFVATDAELAEKILGKRLGKRMIAVTQLKRTRGEHTEEAVLRRVVELEMLGKCVALLLTPQDEFGRVAMAMNGGKAPVSFLTM